MVPWGKAAVGPAPCEAQMVPWGLAGWACQEVVLRAALGVHVGGWGSLVARVGEAGWD